MPSGKKWRRSKVSEKEEVSKIMYLQPTHMHDVGDRNEGSELLVNDVCITKGGVKSRDELDILIERDCNESSTVSTVCLWTSWKTTGTGSMRRSKWRPSGRAKGGHWYFAHMKPGTFGLAVGRLEVVSVNEAEYVGEEWHNAYKYPWGYRVKKRWQVPGWPIDISKRMNAALRHSIGCRQDKKTFSGLPCDEGAWVNVENLMKYDHIWKDSCVLDGTDKADRKKIIERWKTLQRVIYTEFKNSHRVRAAQVLALKATRGELRKIVRTDPQHRILTIINRNKLRLEIGDDEEEVWLWPLAIRAPMGHLKVPWGDWRLSAHISPGVGHVLGGGFHRTHFDSMSRIFHEVCGLEKAVTESAHFWYCLLLGTEGPLTLSDSRTFLTSPSSSTWLRNRYRSMVPDCLQIVTSWSNRQSLSQHSTLRTPVTEATTGC